MGRAYVSFTIGTGRFCLPVEQVVQIVRRENLIGIPRPLPSVAGAINLRGEVIPVLDLRPRLAAAGERAGWPAGKRDPAAEYRRRVVITRHGGRLYGLDVDDVREIVDFDDASITRPGAPAAGVDGGGANGDPAEGARADGAGADGGGARHSILAGVARGESGEFMLLDLAGALDARSGET
jgi:purine-binding chemotaxis protein CheW